MSKTTPRPRMLAALLLGSLLFAAFSINWHYRSAPLSAMPGPVRWLFTQLRDPPGYPSTRMFVHVTTGEVLEVSLTGLTGTPAPHPLSGNLVLFPVVELPDGSRVVVQRYRSQAEKVPGSRMTPDGTVHPQAF